MPTIYPAQLVERYAHAATSARIQAGLDRDGMLTRLCLRASAREADDDGHNWIEKFGVVHRNCRAHGLENLHRPGVLCLPASSPANPTFLAVALAARLEGHLRMRSAGRNSISA